MKIKKLIQDLPIKVFKGNKEAEITGLCSNSKFVVPGNLFISLRGGDEASYIDEAIESGAGAILSSEGNPFLQNVVQLTCDDVAFAKGKLAARYFSEPANQMSVVGITGTNGKTTSCYLIKHLLDSLNKPCGLLGTIEYLIGDNHYPATLTTPDVITIHKLLREMLSSGQQDAVMEVSSHGLMQKRVNEINFSIALFTNLSHEHLDYHKTMDEYCNAKALLFESLSSEAVAIIPYDDAWGKRLIQNCKAKIFTFGFDRKADLVADEVEITSEGSSFRVTYRNQTEKFVWPLIGMFNIKNAIGALSVLINKGFSLSVLSPLLKTFSPPPGRLESIKNNRNLKVFVDYAHKEEALKCVLETLKAVTQGKIITVFGCGGERDREKRPKMAKVVETYSDFAYVTNDNPRGEDPHMICDEIIKGFTKKCYEIDLNRKEAIRKAILRAMPGDVVLIAGKGHESTQVLANQTFQFDDRKIAETFLT